MHEIIELYIRRYGVEFTLRQILEGFGRTTTEYPEYTGIHRDEINIVSNALIPLLSEREKFKYRVQHGQEKGN